jgi:hypothetical protein
MPMVGTTAGQTEDVLRTVYLQVGSESLTARILVPAPTAKSKQSIALGRIFRTQALSCTV